MTAWPSSPSSDISMESHAGKTLARAEGSESQEDREEHKEERKSPTKESIQQLKA